jgi:putative oxidoreductase
MAELGSYYSAWAPRLLSVLRIVTAFLFAVHGAQKLFNAPPSPTGSVQIASLMGVAGILEFFGGLFLLVGLLTRPIAFLLSGMMAVAYFMAHASGGFLPLANKGEPAVLFCFIFLYLAAAGPGPWSVDNLLRRRSNEAESPEQIANPVENVK